MKTIKKCFSIILISAILISVIPLSTFSESISESNITPRVVTGESYINNDYFGSYIKNNGGVPRAESGTLSALGNTIKWQIVSLGDYTNLYAIKSSVDGTYLGITSGTITLTNIGTGAIPSCCKWYMTNAAGGGVLIQNYDTSAYLYGNRPVITTAATVATAGTVEYRRMVWRVATTTYYGSDETYSQMELPSGYKIDTLQMLYGRSVYPELSDEYDGTLWSGPEDFWYSGFDSNYVTVNNTTGMFTAASFSELYSTTVTATHRVTGRSVTFSLIVNPCALLLGAKDSRVDEETNQLIHDHYSSLLSVKSTLLSKGFSDVELYEEDTTGSLNTKFQNKEHSVFVFRGHGEAEYINGSLVQTMIYLHDVASNNAPQEYNKYCVPSFEMSHLKLFMLVACSAGRGGENANNLPSQFVAQGVETAVAFKNVIDCDKAEDWLMDFFGLLDSNYTVYEACRALALISDYSGTTMADYVIFGDGSLKLTLD